MKTIIAGSRDIDEPIILKTALENALYVDTKNISRVICGFADGADKLGELWAIDKVIPVDYYKAQWKVYGNAAGPIRNEEMGKIADQAIILWDGQSRGTKNMIEIMEKAKKPYFVFTTHVKKYMTDKGDIYKAFYMENGDYYERKCE